MGIEVILSDGFRTLRRNKLLLTIPLLRHISQFILIILFGLLLLLVTLALSWSKFLLLTAYIASALFAVLASTAVNSYFHASLIGASSDAVEGKVISLQSSLEWGGRRWATLFTVYILLFIAMLLLLLLFTPSLALLVSGNLSVGLSLGLLTASITSTVYFIAMILLIPLSYIVVLEDRQIKDYYLTSINYVKKNPAASLILLFTPLMLSSLMYAFTSILTGPLLQILRLMNTLAAASAGLLTAMIFSGYMLLALVYVIFSITISVTIESQKAVWWASMLRIIKPQ